MSLDYNAVTSRLLMGRYIPSQEDLDTLLSSGVTHILSLLWDDERNPEGKDLSEDGYLVGRKVTYLHAPIADDHEPKPVEWFAKVLPFILGALAEPHAKVYVHCAAGRSRSGLACYAALRALGFAEDDVERMILAARPNATFWAAYHDSAESALQSLGYTA